MSRARLLLLCPGQGDQHEGMFELARTSLAAKALLADQITLPTGDDIYANRNAQPLIVAATLAMWAAIKDFAPAPSLVAGYSIGELSAYGIAGAIDASQAMALAGQRAQLMDACLQEHPGQALLTISGMPLASASTLATAHGYHVSIETAEDSCIVGGPAAQADALHHAAEAAGARSRRLPVQVASHTPYMQSAVAPFALALQAAAFKPALAPVLAGVDASTVDSKAAAVDTLSRQLAQPIRWLSCMDAAAEAGITVALELGPGSALSKMLQQHQPQIHTRSVADFRSLHGIQSWLSRACED